MGVFQCGRGRQRDRRQSDSLAGFEDGRRERPLAEERRRPLGAGEGKAVDAPAEPLERNAALLTP